MPFWITLKTSQLQNTVKTLKYKQQVNLSKTNFTIEFRFKNDDRRTYIN